MIDTHCHIDAAEFDDDRDAVLTRAAAAGVGRIVVPAIERANFGAVASICREHSACSPAYGIHPLFVARAREDDLAALRETLGRERPVALGEIGLDGFVPDRDEARQEFYFVEQLKIARDLGLPVLLHVRRAVDTILKHLRRIAVPGGIAHAFNGSRQQADEFLKLGFKLGFGGAVTHPRATRLRALATTLPLAALVLETDGPDIAPAWRAGGRSEPADLALTAALLAELRGSTPDEIAVATSFNARAVLPALPA